MALLQSEARFVPELARGDYRCGDLGDILAPIAGDSARDDYPEIFAEISKITYA